MAKDELKKLGRPELLELLLEVEEENEKLKQQVADLQQQLDDRTIRVEKCGDLASAALELNGVFAAAQAACQQYTENMQRRNADVEAKCREMEQAAEEKCRRLEQEAEKKCRDREEETAGKCRGILAEINAKYEQFCSAISEKAASSFGQD